MAAMLGEASRDSVSTRAEVLRALRAERSELFERYHIVAVKLFGSFARDEVHADSDIDLLAGIDTSHIPTWDVYLAEDYLKERLGRNVDLCFRLKPKALASAKEDIVNVF